LKKVFIVEDDSNIRDMLGYALASAGFDVEEFEESSSFWQRLSTYTPSLILLDLMLPVEDGLSILRKMRKFSKYTDIPVIIISAKGSEYDKIKGLDLGADDYIAKPFSILEVISRVKAVLRRYSAEEKSVIIVGNVKMDCAKRSLEVNSISVKLTFREFELLRYLMINEGVVLTRDSLLEKVWGFDYGGESRTVDMHIKSLRQKMKENGSMIKTVHSVGYKLECG